MIGDPWFLVCVVGVWCYDGQLTEAGRKSNWEKLMGSWKGLHGTVDSRQRNSVRPGEARKGGGLMWTGQGEK